MNSMRPKSRFLGIVLVMLSQCLNGVSAQETVVTKFKLNSPTITLHEPVVMNFTILNVLRNSIQFDLGNNRKGNFQFAVTTPQGEKIPLPRIIEDGLTRVGKVSLDAGQTYTQMLLLNEWYPFSMQGKYEIEVRLVSETKTSSGTEIKSSPQQTLDLKVLPRNQDKLQATCESLAKAAIENPVFVQANDAALALSFVNDPIAIPYLKMVLFEGKMVRNLAAIGLGRLATPSAVDILISALNEKDQELQDITRSILSNLQLSIQDQNLQHKIKSALKQQNYQPH